MNESMWKIELKAEDVGGFMPMHRAEIIVGAFTRSGEEEMPTLSPVLATMQELKHYVGKLRKQLDEIESKGKEYFDSPLFPPKESTPSGTRK